MGKKSIGFKLTVILVLVSLLGMAAVYILSYFVMRAHVRTELLEKAYNMLAVESGHIDAWLEKQSSFVESVGRTLSTVSDRAIADRVLKDHYAANEEYLSVYMGLSDDSGIFSVDRDRPGWLATQRGWYKEAMAAGGKTVFTTPYRDVTTGNTVITVTKDIGAFAGNKAAFAVDMETSTVIQVVEELDLYGGYAFLATRDGAIVAHPDSNFSPQGDEYVNMKDDEVYTQVFSSTEHIIATDDYNGVSSYIFKIEIDTSGWMLYVAVPQAAVAKFLQPDIVTIIFSVLFLIAGAVVVWVIIRRMVVRPLVQVVNAGEKLADGYLQIDLPAGSDDEVGQLVGQFGTIVDVTRKQAEVLEAISNRDFTVGITPRSSHDTINIAIQKMVDTISGMLLDIQGSSTQVSSGAQQIADGAQLLAQGATEQSATVEHLASTVAEIEEKTKVNAQTAVQAKELSESIKEKAEQGSSQMDQMMQAVREINESSQSIGNVIKIIDDIAFQTNILSLNAAVEAARAGQHGKGFAVVADEVRNLAAKSAQAAKNTNELIESSIQKAEIGASISRETSESLRQIVEGIARNSELITDIAQSSNEQSAAISEISGGIVKVSQVVQQNSAASEESAAAAQEMSGQSAMLQQLISRFKIKNAAEASARPHFTRESSPQDPQRETGFAMGEKDKYET